MKQVLFALLLLAAALSGRALAQGSGCNGYWMRMTTSNGPLAPPRSVTNEQKASDNAGLFEWMPHGPDYSDAGVRASGLWVTGRNAMSTMSSRRSAEAEAEGQFVELWNYVGTGEGFGAASSRTKIKGMTTLTGNGFVVHAAKEQAECTLHPKVSSDKQFQVASGSATPIAVNLSKWGIGIEIPIVIPGDDDKPHEWEALEDFNLGSMCTNVVLLRDKSFGKVLCEGGGLSLPPVMTKSRGVFHGMAINTLVLSTCCAPEELTDDHIPGTTYTGPSGPSTPSGPQPHLPAAFTPAPGAPAPPPGPPTPHGGPLTPGGGSDCPKWCPFHGAKRKKAAEASAPSQPVAAN